jgi:hypothetical protein
MANFNDKSNITQIFNDLDKYRDFCREYGYRFDERDLYSSQSYVWRQFQKSLAGKAVKDCWEADRIRFKEQEDQRKGSGTPNPKNKNFRKRAEGNRQPQ